MVKRDTVFPQVYNHVQGRPPYGNEARCFSGTSEGVYESGVNHQTA